MKKELILDTNVFLRFLIDDVTLQFREAKEIFGKIEKGEIIGRVSILVINELIWILENYYELKRKVYIPRILKLLALKNLKVIEVKKSLIVGCLEKMEKTKFDFTDIYLSLVGTKKTVFSFDKDLEKLFKK